MRELWLSLGLWLLFGLPSGGGSSKHERTASADAERPSRSVVAKQAPSAHPASPAVVPAAPPAPAAMPAVEPDVTAAPPCPPAEPDAAQPSVEAPPAPAAPPASSPTPSQRVPAKPGTRSLNFGVPLPGVHIQAMLTGS